MRRKEQNIICRLCQFYERGAGLRKSLEKQFEHISPLFAVFCDDYMIITRLIGKQIYELVEECSPAKIASLYLKEMGAVLIAPGSKFELDYTYSGVRHPKLQPVEPSDTKCIIPNNHGWLSINTELCLRFALQSIVQVPQVPQVQRVPQVPQVSRDPQKDKKAPVIVELGSWLGSSTGVMLDAISAGTLYCFDHYQNVTLTDYRFDKPHPLDKFWLTVPRYETFCRNVAPHLTRDKSATVYTVKHDVRRSIDVLKYHFITPHLVYIDAIKSCKQLLEYLRKIFAYAPHVTVVGDDYVFQSVRTAIDTFVRERPTYFLYTTTDCYVLCARSPEAHTGKKFAKYIEQAIAQDPIYELVYALQRKNHTKICERLLRDQTDINVPLARFNNNTFYTLVIIQIYSYKDQSAKKVQKYILENIDKSPKKVQNSLFLTWKDYMDFDIVF
jgi:hypothetical protein